MLSVSAAGDASATSTWTMAEHKPKNEKKTEDCIHQFVKNRIMKERAVRMMPSVQMMPATSVGKRFPERG